jgi:Holliday junction resolvase RusA-like endonuclease
MKDLFKAGFRYTKFLNDVDNLEKCLDAMNGIVYIDDSRVLGSRSRRYSIVPRIEAEFYTH